jgi:hypothetical protein
MAREKAEGLYVEGEVFGRALNPNVRIALARQRVIRAVDFGDWELILSSFCRRIICPVSAGGQNPAQLMTTSELSG